MKDVFKFILFLATVFLVACVCTPEGRTVNEASNDQIWYKIKGSEFISSMPIMKFEYDGHKYIMFGDGEGKSVVHDPNCPCHNHYQSEPVEPVEPVESIYDNEYDY